MITRCMLVLTLLMCSAVNAAEPATAPTTATTPQDDELVESYVQAVEVTQKRFADEIAAAKKSRDEKIGKAEKALRAEQDRATETYVTTAERAKAKHAGQIRTAIAATIAAYDGKIARARRGAAKEKIAAAEAAKEAFAARARRDNDNAARSAAALSGIAITGSGEPTTTSIERGPVIADHIVAVVDDFIVDVYHNGQKVPDSSRRLLDEIHGATVEQIDIEVHRGDWIVFNVANNRLRWGGQSLFMAAGKLNEDGPPVFVTRADHAQWAICDDTSEVRKFIADRAHLSDKPARPPETPWGEGVGRFNQRFPNSQAQPIWGESRSTWIKFLAEEGSAPPDS